MAITFNNSTNAFQTTGSATHTVSFTVNAGDNRLLVVGVAVEEDAPCSTVNGITYDGVALTKIDSQTYRSGDCGVEQWYLLAPNVGTANIVVTWNDSVYDYVHCHADAYNGVKQQAYEAKNKATGTGTTMTVDVTTLTDNAWVVDIVGNNQSVEDMTAGANQTERTEQAGGCRSNTSDEALASFGACTMSWTTVTSRDWGIVGAAFEAAGAAAPVWIPKVIFIN